MSFGDSSIAEGYVGITQKNMSKAHKEQGITSPDMSPRGKGPINQEN
jgi:hypothetical protein